MDSLPLTHHEILTLVGPFTRRGYHVDLQASDRSLRRLAFKTLLRPARSGESGPGGVPAHKEALELQHPEPGRFRLNRVLTLENGLGAHLTADGPDLENLLALMDDVPASSQLRAGEGYSLTYSHRLDSPGRPAARGRGEPARVLTAAAARVAGLELLVETSTVRSLPADVVLRETSGDGLQLPEDLLAVRGHRWSRLRPTRGEWRGSLRTRGREPLRSRGIEAELEAAAAHLATVLAGSPAQFHERFRWARWGVAARRITPLVTCVGLIGAAASVPRLALAQDSVIRMLIFSTPNLLLALAFCRHELPQIEIPPLPRRSTVPTWRRAPRETASVPESP